MKKQEKFKEQEQQRENVVCEENNATPEQSECTEVNNEVEELKAQLDEKSKKCEEYFNMLQRTAAEFDNYKKRTVREKDAMGADIAGDVVTAFLPVVDNLTRAVQATEGETDTKSLKEGVDLVFRQLKDVLRTLGVEEIKSVGEKFDPQLHNAVMHIDDDSYKENVVVEEFQKGYKLKDKVIRHSMVKVAN